MTSRLCLLPQLLAILLMASTAAQVTLKRDAFVYHGNAANTTAPATIDAKKAWVVTVEWQTIESEGVDRKSARGRQLVLKMSKRVRQAVRAVASSQGRDLVVRKKDIADDQGYDVADLTDEVIREIEQNP